MGYQTGRRGSFWTAARTLTLAALCAVPLLGSVRENISYSGDVYFSDLKQDFDHLSENAQGFQSRDQSTRHAYGKWLASGWALRDALATASETDLPAIEKWKDALDDLYTASEAEKIAGVNSFINTYPYVADKTNWDQNDYWSTPVEFLKKGGDCEDFAIAKFYSLRLLGIPANRMELHIVKDVPKDQSHAVLIVDTEDGEIILDNQTSSIRMAGTYTNFQPILRINPEGMHYEHRTPKQYAAVKRAFSVPATSRSKPR